MGKFTDEKILVAGGTGTVGEGIVKVLLREGATVIVPSRSETAITRMREYLAEVDPAKLITVIGNISKPESANEIREQVTAKVGDIDSVIASLGGTWEANLPITEVPIETWHQYFESNLTSHFVLAKTFLPLLAKRPATSYTLLGGLSALLTIPNYSPVGINSAAQLMMTKILMEESKNSGVRINQVIFGMINTRARAAYARPEWVTADEVGEIVAYLASKESYMVNGGIIQLGNKAINSKRA